MNSPYKLNQLIEKLDKEFKGYIKYVGMVRLLRALFNGGGEWEERISEMLTTISERERKVIEMRFGLKGNPMTLEEVARVFGVTKERIRQIEAKALRKLKHTTRKKILLGMTWQEATLELKEIKDALISQRSHKNLGEEHNEFLSNKRNILVCEMDLPTRIANSLLTGGYETVGEIIDASDKDLMKVRNVGRKSVSWIRNVISRL